jgi:hypothetical protein
VLSQSSRVRALHHIAKFPNLARIAHAFSGDHLLRIYEWLSPLAGEFENKQQDVFNLKGRKDGTGRWLLEINKFKDWLSGTGRPSWYQGIRMFPSTASCHC